MSDWNLKGLKKIEIKDSTSGFRMFKKKTLEKIVYDNNCPHSR